MRKIIKLAINNVLVCTIIFVILFSISKIVLRINGLEYLQWVYHVTIFTVVIGSLTGTIQIIKRIQNPMKAVLEVILIVVTLLILIFGKFILFFYVLVFSSEHIVTKNGQKLVGYSYGFRDVSVDYYEYINLFVHKTNKVLHEDYGEGEFDPLDG